MVPPEVGASIRIQESLGHPLATSGERSSPDLGDRSPGHFPARAGHTNRATTHHPIGRDANGEFIGTQRRSRMSVTDLTLSATGLPVGTWRLDPVHSSASFAVKHMAVATF